MAACTWALVGLNLATLVGPAGAADCAAGPAEVDAWPDDDADVGVAAWVRALVTGAAMVGATVPGAAGATVVGATVPGTVVAVTS